MTALDTFLRQATTIVGDDHIHAPNSQDATTSASSSWTVEPATPTQVAQVLALANERHLSVAPRGGGTKAAWLSTGKSAHATLSTRRLDRVLEHAAGDLTATVEAGCTFGTLQNVLRERGQRLALDPLWPDAATIGGIFATADSGMLRGSFGGPRDLILGVTVALADGTLARSGGKVVKNVAGYDLPKLFTGSYGTLGVITQLTLRLHPLPGATKILHFEIETADQLSRFITAMSESSLYTAGVQFTANAIKPIHASVRVEGSPQAIEVKVDRVMNAATMVGAQHICEAKPFRREDLFDGSTPAVVCRTSILPTDIARVFESLQKLSPNCPIEWQFMTQQCGAGLLRLESDQNVKLIDAVQRIRSTVATLGGTAVVLTCPPGLESTHFANPPSDTLPLVQRIKRAFDPHGIMNPNRFLESL